MNTGDLIKKRRLELGLSLNDVAKALKVNKSTVLRYETKEIEKLHLLGYLVGKKIQLSLNVTMI